MTFKIAKKIWQSALLALLIGINSIDIISAQDIVDSETLSVKVIADKGFGCKTNLYSWTMESYKESVYVGTLNVKGKQLGMNLFLYGLPLFTSGAEIHRGTRSDDGSWTWDKVLDGGLTTSKNYGIRKLTTVGDFMYGVTGNHCTGFEVFRTKDGTTWESVITPGFGNKKNTSGRGLGSFKGHVYVGTENRKEGAEIWRRAVDTDGEFATNSTWENVVTEGLSTKNNEWFSDFIVHNDGTNDYLYTGTLNDDGAQLWRSIDGTEWEMIFTDGNGITKDKAIMKLAVFKNKMYLGTMNFADGASLLVSTDETATAFTPLLTNGNGNSNNRYMWYIIEYNSRLYVGTFNAFGQAEFDLYSSADPENDGFVTETLNAFGLANNMYGIRSMVVHDDKLIIGGASNNVPTKVFEATNRTSSI